MYILLEIWVNVYFSYALALLCIAAREHVCFLRLDSEQ